MTRAHEPFRFSPFGLVRGATGFLARIGIGLMLILVAGFVALFTAFLGLVLALAALVFRSAGRKTSPVTAPDSGETLTLEARRTPRGWTVE